MADTGHFRDFGAWPATRHFGRGLGRQQIRFGAAHDQRSRLDAVVKRPGGRLGRSSGLWCRALERQRDRRVVAEYPAIAVTPQRRFDQFTPVVTRPKAEWRRRDRLVIDRLVQARKRHGLSDITGDACDRHRTEPRPDVVDDQLADRRLRPGRRARFRSGRPSMCRPSRFARRRAARSGSPCRRRTAGSRNRPGFATGRWAAPDDVRAHDAVAVGHRPGEPVEVASHPRQTMRADQYVLIGRVTPLRVHDAVEAGRA